MVGSISKAIIYLRQTCVLTQRQKWPPKLYLPPSSLVGLKSSVLVAYSPKTKHEIGSTVGLLGLLEILWIWNCWAKWWLWLFSGMFAEKVLFCFAKILANILGGGYVMLWSCSRWSQMLSRFAKTLTDVKLTPIKEYQNWRDEYMMWFGEDVGWLIPLF